VEKETSNLVDRLIVASARASPRMANHRWKGRGHITWTMQIVCGCKRISLILTSI